MKRSQQRHRARRAHQSAQADALIRARLRDAMLAAVSKTLGRMIERTLAPVVSQMQRDAALAHTANDPGDFAAAVAARIVSMASYHAPGTVVFRPADLVGGLSGTKVTGVIIDELGG